MRRNDIVTEFSVDLFQLSAFSLFQQDYLWQQQQPVIVENKDSFMHSC